MVQCNRVRFWRVAAVCGLRLFPVPFTNPTHENKHTQTIYFTHAHADKATLIVYVCMYCLLYAFF